MTERTHAHQVYEILTSGHWTKKQVKINRFPEKPQLPLSVQQNIDAYWQENILNTVKRNFIYNGELCSLTGWEKNDKLTLDLGFTNYKELIYSNYINKKNQPAEFISNALGISVILTTKDNRLLLIQRSHAVGESPGSLDVLGGHIEPGVHVTAGIPDPFAAMQAELEEEISYKLQDSQILYCIGIIKTTDTRKPELIFSLRSSLSSGEIITHAQKKQCDEISNLIAIQNTPIAISDFISANESKFSPSAIGALELFLIAIKT